MVVLNEIVNIWGKRNEAVTDCPWIDNTIFLALCFDEEFCSVHCYLHLNSSLIFSLRE